MHRSWLLFSVFVMSLSSLILHGQMPQALSLPNAVFLAVEHNLQIKLARAESDVAQLANHVGEAGFLPELNVIMEANESNQDINLTFFSGETINRENAKSQALRSAARVDWTLFDGMRMFATLDRLNAMEEMSRQQLKWQTEDIIAEVVHRYADILVAEKMLVFQESNLDYSRRLLRISEQKVKNGIGDRSEVLRLTADYYADSSMTIRQRAEVSVQKHRFCQLLGMDPTDQFEVLNLPEAMSDLTLDEVLRSAQTDNPELLINRYRKVAAEKSISEERAAFLPTLGSFGEFQDLRQINEVGVLERNFTNGFNYGLRVQWNIFDGNRNRRYVQQAKIVAQTLEWEKEDLERNVRAEAISLWKTHLASKQIGELEQKSNALAEENLDLSLRRFERGIAEDIEVREARRNLTENQLRLLEAQSEEYNALAEILKLMGKGRDILNQL